jgi:murein DD-endopeptidase MepM/ murein hydrolase activator NlpD
MMLERPFKWTLSIVLTAAAVAAAGLAVPERPVIPVAGAGPADWNHETFWYHPWGGSIVHKGIDIFADRGRDVISATPGVVLATGSAGRGGNTVLVLGPKWRVHYYAHLESVTTKKGYRLDRGAKLGTVGCSGNAQGKPAHLHYSVVTLLPYPWRADASPLGLLKMFFLDPGELLSAG